MARFLCPTRPEGWHGGRGLGVPHLGLRRHEWVPSGGGLVVTYGPPLLGPPNVPDNAYRPRLTERWCVERGAVVTLQELTDPNAVLEALNEFDRLGRVDFLKAYGFGAHRGYVVVHDGKTYDSKAIAGVAFGYQFPHRGPLKPADFSGGKRRCVPSWSLSGSTSKPPEA